MQSLLKAHPKNLLSHHLTLIPNLSINKLCQELCSPEMGAVRVLLAPRAQELLCGSPEGSGKGSQSAAAESKSCLLNYSAEAPRINISSTNNILFVIIISQKESYFSYDYT